MRIKQEIFDRIVARLKADTESPTMIEFGSYWTYYGLWFCQVLDGSRVVALEPDPDFMEVGRQPAPYEVVCRGWVKRKRLPHTELPRRAVDDH